MAARTRLAALLVAPALALGACGQSTDDSSGDFKGEQQAVAQAVEDLQSAGRKGDADKICDELLAPALVARIKQTSSGTCDDALSDSLADADAFELQVEKVTVNGDRATATVTSESGDQDRTDTLDLQRVSGTWKIASLG